MPDCTLLHGDCLDHLPTLPAQSVDLVLADLPYGTTACKWDSVLPLDVLWREYRRVLKPRGAVVLTASQPFTTTLISSNLEWFKYTWVWVKSRPFDIYNCKNKPLRKHEDICVFSPAAVANRAKQRMTYNPQGLIRIDKPWKRPQHYMTEHRTYRPSNKLERILPYTNYPTSVLEIANPNQNTTHPTQKPVALMVYLIRTYSNPGDMVLDNTMGSGTTGVAALQEGRVFIGMEQDAGYFATAQTRIAAVDPLWREGAACA